MILFHSIHEITNGLKALYIFKVYLSSEGASERVFHWHSFFFRFGDDYIYEDKAKISHNFYSSFVSIYISS